MANSLRISVIVPVYNTELFIERCLNSIIEQTFTDFEIILIDDNSTDNCPKICEKYVKKDSRIKIIHNETNLGSSLSRKIGLENAVGTYIQFIDSDDWVEKNMLERLYYTAVSGDYDIIWYDFFEKNYHLQQNIESLEKIDIYKKILDNESKISASLWSKFIKKDILLQIDFPKVMMWEDLVITTQLVDKSKKIFYLSEVFYHHFYNPSSITNSKERKTKGIREIIENLTITINFFHKFLVDDFILLEPELSACVNRFKFESIFLKDLRNSDLFLQLYPESNKNIFSKTWKTNFYKKLFLYFYMKKIPGINFFLDLFKCIKY
jgi:glycosyltransferase involved in cell wall biosynthesis